MSRVFRGTWKACCYVTIGGSWCLGGPSSLKNCWLKAKPGGAHAIPLTVPPHLADGSRQKGRAIATSEGETFVLAETRRQNAGRAAFLGGSCAIRPAKRVGG